MAAKRKLSFPDAEQARLMADPHWLLAQRIAQSSVFARATQLRDILIFIVRQAILAPDAQIHEFEIAHSVLGRRSDFNPLDDNIVRVQMAHLRKKLDLYFTTEGLDEQIIVRVALGSYKPIFSNRTKSIPETFFSTEKINSRETAPTPPAQDSQSPSVTLKIEQSIPPLKKAHSLDRALFLSICVAFLLTIACCLLSLRIYHQQRSIEALQSTLTPWQSKPALAALWHGFFTSPHDTDIVIGDNSLLLIEQLTGKLTSFDSYVNRSYLSDPALHTYGPDRRFLLDLAASKSMGSVSEFKLAHRIMALDPLGQKLRLFSARQYTPGLLKQDNVILVGGRVSNPWQNVFSDKLNFVEEMMFKSIGQSAVTNLTAHQGEANSYTSSPEIGYCTIGYFPDPMQNTYVLLLSGTNAEATEAAGDFLLSEEQLSKFLDKLHSTTFPPFEVLLKITQVRGTPLAFSIESYRAYSVPHETH